MNGRFGSYLVANWKRIINGWPFVLWLSGGFFFVCYCVYNWASWQARERLGMNCVEQVLDLALTYLFILPVMLGWIWHRDLLKRVSEQ